MMAGSTLFLSLAWSVSTLVVQARPTKYSTAQNCSLDSPWIVRGILATSYDYNLSNGQYGHVIGTIIDLLTQRLYYAAEANASALTVFTFYPCSTRARLTYPKSVPHDPVKAVYGHLVLEGFGDDCLGLDKAALTLSVSSCPLDPSEEAHFGFFTHFGGNDPALNPITVGWGTNASDLWSVAQQEKTTSGPVLFGRHGHPLTFIPPDQIELLK